MERNFAHIDLGYEFWCKDYMFRKSIEGEREAYFLWVEMYKAGTVRNVDEFLEWILANRPDMVYNYVDADRRYREENEPKIRKFFAEHIEGRSLWCIDDDVWDFYSDWHKDVFGYRPHAAVCGEYINPHITADPTEVIPF